MASKDDRQLDSTLAGLPSQIIPDHSRRWPTNGGNGGIPIAIPGTTSRPRGNAAVINPYSTIGSTLKNGPQSRTNRTANQTLLSSTTTKHSSRSFPRDTTFGQSLPPNSLLRHKGKGKAFEPRSRPAKEIIDVDASTDDLDILSTSPPTTSRYFAAKPDSTSQANGDGPMIGPSLVEDGEHTQALRAKFASHEAGSAYASGRDLQRRSSSPIELFPEDGVQEKPVEAKTRVQGMAADYDAKVIEGMRVVDFKKLDRTGRSSMKARMQPKGGGGPKALSMEIITDRPRRKSESSIAPSKRKAIVSRLPISTLMIGRRQLKDSHCVTLDDGEKAMTFEGKLKESIGPIAISSINFAGFQYTDPSQLNELSRSTMSAVVCYLESAPTMEQGFWASDYGRVFSPGTRNNNGQISMLFDTTEEQWSLTAYRSFVTKLSGWLSLPRSKVAILRLAAATTLWKTLTRSEYESEQGQKFRFGDLDDLGESVEELKILPDRQSSKDTQFPEAEATARKKQVDEIQKFRESPASDSVISARKRPSPPDRREQTSSEIVITHPPAKKQRVEPSQPLRRSSRRQEKSPGDDADEVILVFPFGVPGAINVTKGDLARLQPGEFLNDTLIEFGLKAWLKELEIEDPEVASQVHVFNSFFYKKLNKRNIKEGYESVRKWTSKVDIFSKKYIVVPINEHLHWYLAIIYEPEHTLQPPPPSHTPHTNAVTRQQAREIQAAEQPLQVETESSTTESKPQNVIEIVETRADPDDDLLDGMNSETEVEKAVAFSASCSVTTTNEHSSTTTPASELKEAWVNESISRKETPEIEPGSPMNIDIELPQPDAIDGPSRFGTSDTTMGSGSHTPIEIPDDSQSTEDIYSGVTPAKFYRKSFTKWGGYRANESAGEPIIIGEPRKKVKESLGEPIIVDDVGKQQPRTKIFILDSLGNRHPQAMKQLNKWLELEAMDKKKVKEVTSALSKMAQVPVQPNFCDCGLYVLHFTKIFMTDPQRYCDLILTKERSPMADRQEDWHDRLVKDMREELQHKILQFSDEWRQLRAAREDEKKREQQQQEEEEDEDSDVAIVEHVKPSGRKGKSGKSSRTKT